MPSICTPNDANQLVSQCIKSKKDVQVFCNSIVTSESFIQSCSESFDRILATKAEQVGSSIVFRILTLPINENTCICEWDDVKRAA